MGYQNPVDGFAAPSNPNPGLSAADLTDPAPSGDAGGGHGLGVYQGSNNLAPTPINIVPPGPAQQNGVFLTMQPNYKAQYSIQASLGISQQIGRDLSLELGYSMFRGVHIEQNLEVNYVQDPARSGKDCTTPGETNCSDPFVGPGYNYGPGNVPGVPGAIAGTLGVVPNPPVVPGEIAGQLAYEQTSQVVQNDQTASTGSSIYHGLTASLTKRYSKGLQFQANYTYSRAIDDTSDFSVLSTPYRPQLVNLDRSASAFNITHSFVFNAVYTTHEGPVFGKALSNITIAPIVSLRSGVPFSLLVPGIGKPTLLPPFSENNGPQFVYCPASVCGTTTYSHFGAGFHLSEARPYHAGRNTGIGPDYFSWDMRVSKPFIVNRERGIRLEVVVQASNILNRSNFSSVNNIFPNTYETANPNVTCSGTPPTCTNTGTSNGPTATADVLTGEGTVHLLNGPYRFKGYKPHAQSDLSTPLSFRSDNLPRQFNVGLQLSF